MLTVREVMKALSHEHPDAPVMIRTEALFYVPDEDAPDDVDKNYIDPELTEVKHVAASSVKRNLNGEVVIE